MQSFLHVFESSLFIIVIWVKHWFFHLWKGEIFYLVQAVWQSGVVFSGAFDLSLQNELYYYKLMGHACWVPLFLVVWFAIISSTLICWPFRLWNIHLAQTRVHCHTQEKNQKVENWKCSDLNQGANFRTGLNISYLNIVKHGLPELWQPSLMKCLDFRFCYFSTFLEFFLRFISLKTEIDK